MLLVTVLVLLALQGANTLPESPIVRLGQGMVMGRRMQSAGADGYLVRDYAAFYGIPFAKAPVGELRFKPPQPAAPLTGVLNASEEPPVCIQQRRQPSQGVVGEEDCLKVHIFTPSFDRPNLDVIVFIHGGGFIWGDGKRNGEEYLMDRDVILVTFEYRLGILGYLSLEDEELPGNLGMLDQVLALKWIKDNIGVFGGNSNSITLLGFSAGSSSGYMHTLSPLSKGLFHRFIALSGSPLNPWSRQFKARESALRVGQLLNCTSSSSKQLITCMQGKPAQQIVDLQRTHFQGYMESPFSPFSPVVDGRTSKSPFLPDDPMRLLKDKKVVTPVPVIVGLCKDEGLFTAAEFLRNVSALREIDRDWAAIAPGLLHYHASLTTAEDMTLVARRIRDEYLGNASVVSSPNQLLQMMTDRNFAVGVQEQARLQAAATAQPVHMYHFAYRGQYSLSQSMSGFNGDMGVSHGDDLMYPFLFKWAGVMTTPADQLMRKQFIDMWATFANSSVARLGSAVWTPVSRRETDDLQYLLVKSPTNMTATHTKDLARSMFWKSLPFVENGSPPAGLPSASSPLAATLVTLLVVVLHGMY